MNDPNVAALAEETSKARMRVAAQLVSAATNIILNIAWTMSKAVIIWLPVRMTSLAFLP